MSVDITEHNKIMLTDVRNVLKTMAVTSVDFEDTYRLGDIRPSGIVITIVAEVLKNG